ncbi:MAG: hypothetical protein ACKVRP_09715 [Bacteroidota bacterium]
MSSRSCGISAKQTADKSGACPPDFLGKKWRAGKPPQDAPESYFNGKVRYDAEESGESEAELVAKGRAASAFLKKLLRRGTKLRLEYDKERRDKYSRLFVTSISPTGRW